MDSFEPLITTRTANKEEFERVVELSKNMIHPQITGIDNDRWVQNPIAWMEEETQKNTAQVVVAHDAATKTVVASGIGICFEEPNKHDGSKEKIGYIRWMSTAEDFRGFGVGEQILNHLMNWFDEKNANLVKLHATDKATEFYSQHGFKQDPDTDIWWRKN